MIIICGNSVAEVERDLEMMKLAIASGKPIGIGGATPSEVEKALATLKQYMGGAVAPTTNPCGGTCGCQCNGCMTDEEEATDPVIGYQWYIRMPNGEEHVPHEKTFASMLEAVQDGELNGYSRDEIFVDKVEDDGGSITVLEHCIVHDDCPYGCPYGECPNCGEPLDEDGYCDSCGYDDSEDGYGYEEEEETCEPEPLPSIVEMLDALASGDMNRITAMAKRMGME